MAPPPPGGRGGGPTSGCRRRPSGSSGGPYRGGNSYSSPSGNASSSTMGGYRGGPSRGRGGNSSHPPNGQHQRQSNPTDPVSNGDPNQQPDGGLQSRSSRPSRNRKKKPLQVNNAVPSRGNARPKNRPPPPLQLPHVKITMRRVEDVEKYGTDEKMMSLIQTLLQKSELVTLDEPPSTLSNVEPESPSKPETPPDGKETTVPEPTPQTPAVSVFTVTARILYLTPPHKSRRRGLIPGTGYLVLIPHAPPNTPLQTGAERSRAVASAKLALENVHVLLTSLADSMNIFVQVSPSQKTWREKDDKPQQLGRKGRVGPDRYEGTIDTNDDYLNFLEGLKQEEEERAQRPKPIPGGGVESDKKDTEEATKLPVASLIQYLLNKKEDMKSKRSNNTSNNMGGNKKKISNSPANVKLLEKNAHSNRAGARNHGRNANDDKNKKEKPVKKDKKKKKKNTKGPIIGTPTILSPSNQKKDRPIRKKHVNSSRSKPVTASSSSQAVGRTHKS